MIEAIPRITADEFQQVVRDFRFTPIVDGHGYRHLRFSHPENGVGAFDIIAWPGHLCHAGDLGTFVFSAELDMFTLFRGTLSDLDTFADDLPEVAESHLAYLKSGKFGDETVIRYSPDVFRLRVEQFLDLSGASSELRAAVAERLVPVIGVESLAVNVLHELLNDDFPDPERGLFNPGPCEELSFSYQWACASIAWAVEFYDDLIADLDKDRQEAEIEQAAAASV